MGLVRYIGAEKTRRQGVLWIYISAVQVGAAANNVEDEQKGHHLTFI
jgi:hypothetical protein